MCQMARSSSNLIVIRAPSIQGATTRAAVTRLPTCGCRKVADAPSAQKREERGRSSASRPSGGRPCGLCQGGRTLPCCALHFEARARPLPLARRRRDRCTSEQLERPQPDFQRGALFQDSRCRWPKSVREPGLPEHRPSLALHH